ncbi:MAG: VOC family protein [Nitrososphaerales archaeon]
MPWRATAGISTSHTPEQQHWHFAHHIADRRAPWLAVGRVQLHDYSRKVRVGDFDSMILYVGNLEAARDFYAGALGLPVVFEDEIIVVVGGRSGRVVLHRSDRGHDERGIFPAGSGVGGAAVRFTVEDPDACEQDARSRGLTVAWPTQDASWGRFVVLSDPDGRSIVLAKMQSIPTD